MADVAGTATPRLASQGTFTDRVNAYPTHEHEGYKLRVGNPFPFGATFVPGGVNFSVYSSHATSCSLVLFAKGEDQPAAEIPFAGRARAVASTALEPYSFRIGNVFTMIVFDLDVENIEY